MTTLERLKELRDKWADPEFWEGVSCRMGASYCADELSVVIADLEREAAGKTQRRPKVGDWVRWSKSGEVSRILVSRGNSVTR